MTTLGELYARACRWRGGRDFLVDPAERVTGDAAWRLSSAFARGLVRRGLGQGDVVAFLCKPSARHALGWFGVPLAGAVACSMHVRETPMRLGETLAWLGARFVVHDADLAPLVASALEHARRDHGHAPQPVSLGAAEAGTVGWDALVADGAAAGDLRAEVRPDDLAALVLSSGSTGRPKGVMHTHRTLVENAKAGQQLYGTIGVHDATLIVMQPSFAAWMNVVVPYVGGRGKVVFSPGFTPAGFMATLAAERITMAPAVPTMWRMIFATPELPPHDLSAVKCVSISGEPPARADLETIAARVSPGIASFYASSEAGTGAAVLATTADTLGRTPDGRVVGPGKPESTGKPIAGADLRIVAPDGPIDAELPRGTIGEIVLAGTSTAVGYWKDEALTRARFVDGWWRSGDVGYVDDDGDLFVLGRIDNVINTGGMKVHGEEVERVLLAHPAVAQAAVVGAPDAQWGERIEAHVVLRPGATADAATLEAHCRADPTLAAFKVPKAFHFPTVLPTGPTGKLYRRGLRGG
jgi:acyl-CoA synthetase (AMP-forming)/AMP-acid ligase II